jgi:hypothetical protein
MDEVMDVNFYAPEVSAAGSAGIIRGVSGVKLSL